MPKSLPTVRPATRCPVCGHEVAWRIGTLGRDGDPLESVLCRRCGHAWTDPLPDEQALADFYARRYRAEYKSVMQPKPYHVLRAARVAAGRAGILRPLTAEGGRHLDIGAGGGEFACLMHRTGHKVTAIEPNRGYADFARSEYGLDIINGTLQSARFEPASFDSATLFHVLEHLRDPVAALRTIGAWLREGGVFYLEVPNLLDIAQSPRSRFHRAHIHHFTEPTLRIVLARAGFAVDRVWLTPDGGVISAIAHRAAAPVAEPAPDPAQAQRCAQILARHTPMRHALRMGWLARAVKKQARRIEEKWTALRPPRDRLVRLSTPAEVSDKLAAAEDSDRHTTRLDGGDPSKSRSSSPHYGLH